MSLKLLPRIIWLTFYVLGIIVVGTAAILIASGYRFNFSDGRTYKVSIVHFVSVPVADIEINGVKSEHHTPDALYLEPGDYNISLSKDGYTGASYHITLDSGSLYEVKDIALFKTNIIPNIQPNPKPDLSALTDSSLSSTNSDLFISNDHEIWANGQLVTRLSSPIKSLVFYSNRNYIVYQTDSYVGVVRTDGYNNTKLFDYSSIYNLNFNFKNHGQTLEASDFKNSITAVIN
jgi:hypothetical protein